MAAPEVSIHICRCPAGPALTMLMIGTADIIHGYHHVPRAVSTPLLPLAGYQKLSLQKGPPT